MRPTRELADVMIRFVFPPDVFTVNADGFCAAFLSSREKQPVAPEQTNASRATATSSGRNKSRFGLFTGGDANQSARACHWSFRGRDIHHDPVKKLEEKAQATDGKPFVI